MTPTLSVLGLYEYDSSLFDDMSVPTGMDKSTLVNNILMECAELEVFLPNPAIMKSAIKFWSAASLQVWTKLYQSTQFVYNPIWNKDGTITETHDFTNTKDVTQTTNMTNSRDVTRTDNLKQSTDMTDTHNLSLQRDYDDTYDKSAYNATTYQHVDKHVINDDTSDTGTLRTAGTIDNTGTVRDAGTVSDSGTVRDAGTDRNAGTMTRTEQGNIGITTTQQMIKEEREIDQFNIYDYIVRSFKERFCILVY